MKAIFTRLCDPGIAYIFQEPSSLQTVSETNKKGISLLAVVFSITLENDYCIFPIEIREK